MAIGEILPAATAGAAAPPEDPARRIAFNLQSSPTAPAPVALSDNQVKEAAQTIGEVIGIINRGLRVTIDESTNRVITQIIDRDTNEVIRQIPPQELIDLSKRLRELVGVLFDIEV